MIEYDFAISLEETIMENGIYRMYFPYSCVIYLRGKGRKDNLELEIIMPDGQKTKKGLEKTIGGEVLIRRMIDVIQIGRNGT